MNSILCAADHKRPVLVLLSLASEADPRLGRLLDLKKNIAVTKFYLMTHA